MSATLVDLERWVIQQRQCRLAVGGDFFQEFLSSQQGRPGHVFEEGVVKLAAKRCNGIHGLLTLLGKEEKHAAAILAMRFFDNQALADKCAGLGCYVGGRHQRITGYVPYRRASAPLGVGDSEQDNVLVACQSDFPGDDVEKQCEPVGEQARQEQHMPKPFILSVHQHGFM